MLISEWKLLKSGDLFVWQHEKFDPTLGIVIEKIATTTTVFWLFADGTALDEIDPVSDVDTLMINKISKL